MYEFIDLVCFIGNCLSGKMGIVVVDELCVCGVAVYLILGLFVLLFGQFGVEVIWVGIVWEMYEVVIQVFNCCDVVVLVAVVVDYCLVEVVE